MATRILYAVNNETFERVLKKKANELAPGKYEFVDTALYREQVINLINTHKPDVVILREKLEGSYPIDKLIYDIKMNHPTIRLVLYTAKTEPGEPLLKKAVQYGVYDLITGDIKKPGDMVEILENPRNMSHVAKFLEAPTIHRGSHEPIQHKTVYKKPKKKKEKEIDYGPVNPIHKEKEADKKKPKREVVIIEEDEDNHDNVEEKEKKGLLGKLFGKKKKKEDNETVQEDSSEEENNLEEENPSSLEKKISKPHLQTSDKPKKEIGSTPMPLFGESEKQETNDIKKKKIKEEKNTPSYFEREHNIPSQHSDDDLDVNPMDEIGGIDEDIEDDVYPTKEKHKEESFDKKEKSHKEKETSESGLFSALKGSKSFVIDEEVEEEDDDLFEEVEEKSTPQEEPVVEVPHEEEIVEEMYEEDVQDEEEYIEPDVELTNEPLTGEDIPTPKNTPFEIPSNDRDEELSINPLEELNEEVEGEPDVEFEEDEPKKTLFGKSKKSNSEVISSNKNIITFLGSTHGTGNTHVAFNTALLLAQNGNKVLYVDTNSLTSTVDFSLQLGKWDKGIDKALEDMKYNNGSSVSENIIRMKKRKKEIKKDNARSVVKKMYDPLPDTLDTLFYSQDYQTLEVQHDIPKEQLKDVLLRIKEKEDYDVIVVDSEPIGTPGVDGVVGISDKIYVVMTQDASKLGVFHRQFEALQKRMKVDGKPYIIVNQFTNIEPTVKRIQSWVQQGNSELEIIQTIPFTHKGVVLSNYQGIPFILKTKNESAIEAFQNLMEHVAR